jgi:hypothetical protein
MKVLGHYRKWYSNKSGNGSRFEKVEKGNEGNNKQDEFLLLLDDFV